MSRVMEDRSTHRGQDAPRLFLPGPLSAGADVAATEAQAHYLVHVMRRAAGDLVRVFDGVSGEWSARLARAGKGAARLTVEAQLRAQTAEPDLWLAFAPLKRDATDLVVQKATELGAAALLPVFTERTNAARINLERAQAIAIEAAEQSERLSVPTVMAPVRLAELLACWPPGRRLAAAIERSAPAPFPPDAGGLLVGPEGGFSAGELDFIRRSPFICAVSLGPRVLRAETAAIVGLALLQERTWSA
jgi:16S rRNA (uracil1498-N3)-methyltransferase